MPSITALAPAHRDFLAHLNVASVATTDDDGAPRQTVTWFRLEADDRVLINGRLPRRWCANLARDPRVSLAIVDANDSLRWLGLSGVVAEVINDDSAKDDIVALAHRYASGSPDEAMVARFRTQPRISYRVRVTGIHDHLAG